MKRVYIETREYSQLHTPRAMRLDEVHVEVSVTLLGDAQYCVMGHDQLTGAWYPVSRAWPELRPAWEACEAIGLQLAERAREEREGERHGSTL